MPSPVTTHARVAPPGGAVPPRQASRFRLLLKLGTLRAAGDLKGMALRRNGNVELLQVINGVLATLKKDGGYDELYATWFGTSPS